MSQTAHTEHVIDSESGKMGMWIFLFTELFLFGGLFLVYAVMRFRYSEDFHEAALELNALIGTLNTVVLLISSMTVAMSITAVQRGKNKQAVWFLLATLILALVFMVNKYFEWSHKFHLHLYPGSEIMANLPHGETQFFGLYYIMTGLHAIHVIVGAVLLIISMRRVISGRINKDKYLLLENSGLYWHLVDLIWIFLYPLLYLVT
ncbi:cytochrome c oxidase subunit 3 family protein [Saccharicrinis sp. FJH54]|uniref:cytochrome c oxidase subunit 3 family protein n=1 Tax=Saccharicrinis sp. FJH54 TaxID=3344665 RepID=UPI0035D488BB